MSPIAWRMRVRRVRGPGLPVAGLAALLLMVAGAVMLATGARGETGAPALEQDGVWRAHGDWVIEPEEEVIHADETVEVFGNVTVGLNASLSFVNSTFRFGVPTGASRLMAVNQGVLIFTNTTAIAVGGASLSLDSAAMHATTCTLRFEGSAGAAASIRASAGTLKMGDCQILSDAGLALDAIDAGLQATDCDFARLNGTSANLQIAGSGVHELDTTRFATLFAKGKPWVALYVTVRFLLQSPQGVAVPGHVNGTGAYGEIFSLDTAPDHIAAMRFTWLREPELATNITEGLDHGPHPLMFAASHPSTGGNTSSVWLTHHRENITVPLEGPFDLAVTTFIIQGRSLSGPTLKRAYYLHIGEDYTLFVQISNQGAEASPPTRLSILRTSLEASSWTRGAAGPTVEMDVPSIAAGEVWGQGIPVHADTFGGRSTSVTACSESAAYTSLYTGSLAAALDGDFAAWNNERQLTAIAYDVVPVEGQQCARQNDTMVAALGVGFAAAVGGAAVIGFQFSEKQVARRAARAAQRKAEAPKEPPAGKP